MAGRTDVYVGGFTALSKKLKAIEPALQVTLRDELKDIAEGIASKVRSKIPVRTGRARSSVRAGATQSSAYVQEGKKSVPYVGWLDFGGVLRPKGGRHNTITRPVIKAGRYLYPTVAAERERTVDAASDAFIRAAHRAGFND